MIEATNIKKIEERKIHDLQKEISATNLFINNLITSSTLTNLENIFIKRKRSREIDIISDRNCQNCKNKFI